MLGKERKQSLSFTKPPGMLFKFQAEMNLFALLLTFLFPHQCSGKGSCGQLWLLLRLLSRANSCCRFFCLSDAALALSVTIWDSQGLEN